jgi:hypothetical protein
MHGLQDQNLQYQDVIERWTPATRAVPPGNRHFQRGPEHLEINQSGDAFKAIALCGNIREPRIDVKEPR